MVRRPRPPARPADIFAGGSSASPVFNRDDVTCATLPCDESEEARRVIRMIHAMLGAERGKGAAKKGGRMFQTTSSEGPFDLPVQKIDNNEFAGGRGRFGIDTGRQHIIRNDKAQPASQRVCIVMRNAMQFAVFHADEHAQKRG